MILSILLGAALIGSLWLTYRVLTIKLRHKRKFSFYANGFYDSVKPLLEDDETPENMLDLLSFLGDRIQDKGALSSFISYVTRGKMIERDESARQNSADLQKFLESRPELSRGFYAAITNAMLAMSYNGGMIRGLLFRVWLSGGISSDDETVRGADPRCEGVATRWYSGKDMPQNLVGC